MDFEVARTMPGATDTMMADAGVEHRIHLSQLLVSWYLLSRRSQQHSADSQRLRHQIQCPS